MKNDEIQILIKEIIEKTNIPVNSIVVNDEEITSGKGRTTWFSVEIADPHLYLGRGGEGISALNYLVRKIIETRLMAAQNKEASEITIPEILVDINGFQKKRVESVRAVAHMMAERARYFKSNIEVDPMPAFERRIVHEFLSDAIDLKTESEGTGPGRRVVIKYVGSI